MPQGGAQAGDDDFRGVQAVAHSSIREGKGCGAAGAAEFFLSVDQFISWLQSVLAIRQRVSLCLSGPCPAPKRSYLDTDSSGKVLIPVSSVTRCFPSPWLSLSSWEPQPDEAVTPLSLFPLLHNGGPQMPITPTPLSIDTTLSFPTQGTSPSMT